MTLVIVGGVLIDRFGESRILVWTGAVRLLGARAASRRRRLRVEAYRHPGQVIRKRGYDQLNPSRCFRFDE